jgi:hypothetical protein
LDVEVAPEIRPRAVHHNLDNITVGVFSFVDFMSCQIQIMNYVFLSRFVMHAEDVTTLSNDFTRCGHS